MTTVVPLTGKKFATRLPIPAPPFAMTVPLAPTVRQVSRMSADNRTFVEATIVVIAPVAAIIVLPNLIFKLSVGVRVLEKNP